MRELIRGALIRTAPSGIKALQRGKVRFQRQLGSHVEPELALLSVLVDPSRSAVDVGAHKGLYSALIEPIVGSDRLYLFEPVPELHSALKRMYPNAHVSNQALSDGTGEVTLFVPALDDALRPSRATLEPATEGPGRAVTVDRTTLDRLVDQGVLDDVGFVKVDVEGHERHLLEGALAILERQRAVWVVEIEQRHHEMPVSDLIRWVCDFGYEAVVANPLEGRCLRFEEFDIAVHQRVARSGTAEYLNNVTFLPRERAQADIVRLDAILASWMGGTAT